MGVGKRGKGAKGAKGAAKGKGAKGKPAAPALLPGGASSAAAPAAACRFGWGCTRTGCWYAHPDGREGDGDAHPISKVASSMQSGEVLAARAARFEASKQRAKQEALGAEAASGAAGVISRPFAPIAGAGRSKLVATNKQEAMRRFYVRLLNSHADGGGLPPTALQQAAAVEAGLDLLELEAAAKAERQAARAGEKERLRARLAELEAARQVGGAAAAVAQEAGAEGAKRRRLDGGSADGTVS
eukprot:SAG22_NODE_1745_length_3666_cov_1.403140_7_plen_243_part_00